MGATTRRRWLLPVQGAASAPAPTSPRERDLLTQAEYEQHALELFRGTEDAREGRVSFQEGRSPRFSGR